MAEIALVENWKPQGIHEVMQMDEQPLPGS